MGIFGGKKQKSKLQELREKRQAVRERLEELQSQKEEALAQVVEAEDRGSDSQADRRRLKQLKDELEILTARLGKMQSEIRREAEAEFERELKSAPGRYEELIGERKQALERAMKAAAEADFLLKSYFLNDDQPAAITFKQNPYGFKLPEDLVLLLGTARGFFNARRTELAAEDQAAVSFLQRFQYTREFKQNGGDKWFHDNKILSLEMEG